MLRAVLLIGVIFTVCALVGAAISEPNYFTRKRIWKIFRIVFFLTFVTVSTAVIVAVLLGIDHTI